MDGGKRANIKIGAAVKIVQKQDQRTGKLTEGVVQRILTNSANHPHGIKVMLRKGEVGRVKHIIPKKKKKKEVEEEKPEQGSASNDKNEVENP